MFFPVFGRNLVLTSGLGATNVSRGWHDGHCDCIEEHDVSLEHRDGSKFKKSHHGHRDRSKYSRNVITNVETGQNILEMSSRTSRLVKIRKSDHEDRDG